MSSNFAMKRPAYTNNEIVSMFVNKMERDAKTTEKLAEEYNVNKSVIDFMCDRHCQYNYQMLNIASDFLNIDYDNLVEIVEDDENCSLRADDTEAAIELEETLNYLFNEMINQRRLASV